MALAETMQGRSSLVMLWEDERTFDLSARTDKDEKITGMKKLRVPETLPPGSDNVEWGLVTHTYIVGAHIALNISRARRVKKLNRPDS